MVIPKISERIVCIIPSTLTSYIILLLIHIIVVRYILKSDTIFHLPLMAFSGLLVLFVTYLIIM
ncbi:hypothetical protein MASR2M15_18040 [Anaerolineales bacterium]